MNSLGQKDIEVLDKLASVYGCEVLLPPVGNSLHPCIFVKDATELNHLYESLFYEGFSFICKVEDGISFIEVAGIYHAEAV